MYGNARLYKVSRIKNYAMYENDHRIVMTLDAGGTNFVFSAIRGCREIVAPVRLDAVNDDIARCLDALVAGFEAIEKELLPEKFSLERAIVVPFNGLSSKLKGK